MSHTMAMVTITGFAIQQALELVDFVVTILAKLGIKLFSAVKEETFKKWINAWVAFGAGLIIVNLTKLSLLGVLACDLKLKCIDYLVTALALAAGTDAFNTLTKYFQYLKDGRKQKLLQSK